MKSLFPLLSFLIMLSLTCLSQNPVCKTVAGPAALPVSNCAFNCNYYDDYLPLPNDSIIYIRLNFHYLKMAVTQAPFDNVTYAEAAATVSWVNDIYDSLWRAQIRVPGVPYIKRSRIRFVLNSFSKHIDSVAYWSWGYSFNALNSYISDPTAIDVVFKGSGGSSAWHGYGEANGIPGKAVKFDDFEGGPVYNWWYYPQTLAHELGHCLGLCHTVENCSCMSDIDPIPEAVAGGVCDPLLDSTTTNNMMAQVKFGCNRYLSPRQLDLCHYNIRNTFLFNTLTPASQHYVRTAHSNDNVIITATQTWVSDRYMKGNIIVKPGNTLTIKCTVAMQENGKIIVEKGARLNITGGTVTNIYGRLWKGIEVEGDNTQDQNMVGIYAAHQGYLTVTNGSAISNALVGVCNYTTTANGFCDFASTGGIIFGFSSSFLNNQIDAEFFPYTSAMGNDKSNFSYCSFKVDAPLGMNATPWTRAHLFVANGIRFNSCIFENTSSLANGSRGSAISSLDSHFTIEGFSPNASRVEGFDNGISAGSVNPLKIAVIRNTIIKDNINNSVYLYNMLTPVFEQNTVTTASYGNGVGLYLDNCKYYNIKNNSFEQNSALINGGDVGLYINNSQSGAHSIYRNSFSNFALAIGAMYDNSGISNITDGLKMNCNDFSLQPNAYDITLLGTSPTAMYRQGFVYTGPETLVRNRYAAPATTSYGEVQWYIQGTSMKPYIHGSNTDANAKPTPQPVKSDVVVNIISSSFPFDNGQCPSGIPPVCPMPCFLSYINPLINTAVNENASLQAIYTATLDGGNTSGLLNTVNSRLGEDVIYNEVSVKSPYLSDTVLKAYFKRSATSNSNLKSIYDKNKPVSVDVWQVIVNKNLSATAMQYLNGQQALPGISTRATLEARVNLADFNLKNLAGQKMNYFLNDTLLSSKDSIIAGLTTNLAKWQNADLLLFYAYFNKGAFGQAASVASSIAGSLPKVSNYFTNLILLYTSHDGPNSILTNTVMANFFMDYAADSSNFGYAGAKALLKQIKNINYEIPYLRPLKDGKRMGEENEDGINNNGIATNANFNLFPNPTLGGLSILIDMPDETPENDQEININITDITGRLVHSSTIKNKQQAELDLSHLINGVYLLSASKKDQIIYRNKVVKLN